ncbi:MAG TPA: RidA family protein [Vicinamibacterales bacterium]|nr:RidA family protein [Vicinamibacterales bacterium]
MSRRIVTSDRVMPPRMPQSQAVRMGNLVFVSGTVGFAPDGAVARGDIRAQTRQTLENVKAVLEAAGSSLDRTVKVTVVLTDMAHAAAMNEVYGAYFTAGNYPARSLIQAGLPNPDLLVEVECVAEV